MTIKTAPKVEMNRWQQACFMFEFNHNPLATMERLRDTYNDLFWLEAGSSGYYIATLPHHIKDILVTNAQHVVKSGDYTHPVLGLRRFFGNGLLTSEGNFWKRQRKLAAPAFHAVRIEAYAERMVHYAAAMTDRWRGAAQLNVAEEMLLVTLDVISETLVGEVNREENLKIADVLAKVQQITHASNLMPGWFAEQWYKRADSAARTLDEVIYPMIERRRIEGVDRGDVLSMLLSVEDADGVKMTDEEVRDEIVILFLAGHETTANALNWSLYLLSQHPEAEAHLHVELDSVLGDHLPTLNDLPRLPYTHAVIKEAMRVMPPVPGISRATTAAIQVGEYTIPAGSGIGIYPWLTHRHPMLWDEPTAFRPERFLPQNEDAIDRWAYFPFGAGHRICIGNSFAMLEAQLILATVASRYRMELAPGTQVEPVAAITLYPKNGLPMIPHVRQRASRFALT